MANSKITIEFLQLPVVNDVIKFTESKLGLILNEVFKNLRLGTEQTSLPSKTLGRYEINIPADYNINDIGVKSADANGAIIINSLISMQPYSEASGRTYLVYSSVPVKMVLLSSGYEITWDFSFTNTSPAGGNYSNYISNNYKSAFTLDYNYSNMFTVTTSNGADGSGIGTVVIEANYINAFFAVDTNTAAANITIVNQIISTPIAINSISYSQAAIPCEQARVNVTTSVLATKVVSPVAIVPNFANPFVFDAQRETTYTIIVENAEGQQSKQIIKAPSILNAEKFSVSIVNSPNGATVSIAPFDQIGLLIEYSLDGLNWKSESVFSGLDVGSFTLYVRDQLGCSFTKPFEVVEFGIYTPYFYISKSNSIRFANRITWGDSANYKNDENTLGCEVDEEHAYCGRQNFKTANVITTQFKSNYGLNTAKVIKSDLSEVDIPIVKITKNIGIKDKRDARKYNLGNNKTGIYFTYGNIYNFDTNTSEGTHYLNGTLPDWAVINGYITISGAWYSIKDIFYDEDKSADIIVITSLYTGADASVIVGSVYNDFNYEVYEFTIDMVNYIDQTIQVRLNNDDDNFESVVQLSEKIDVAVNFKNNLEIKYWNNDNTDIFYASGIRNLINVELTKQEGVSEGESDTYKTDTNALLLSAQLYELDKFTFEPVSKEIWRKMMIALSHKNVFINGIQYVKNGEFETEPALNKSNLYFLKATLLKTGVVFNSDSSTGDDFNTGSIEIPGLIETEIGFVKY